MKSKLLLLALLITALFSSVSNAEDLESDVQSLPFNTATVAQVDWLVAPVEQKAGVFRDEQANEITLSNGLIRRTIRIQPNAGTVALDDLGRDESLLRGVKPEASITLNGKSFDVGGLTGQPNFAYLTQQWIEQMTDKPGSLKLQRLEVGPIKPRLEWKQVRRHANQAAWPPQGVTLSMSYAMPPLAELEDESIRASVQQLEGVEVTVHYALYDGIPAYSKWLTVTNHSEQPITIDRFTNEVLAAVEYESRVEDRDVNYMPPNIHVETDMAFGGFTHRTSNRHTVHWEPDPEYGTQVNWLRKTPCLLSVRPTHGPSADVAPGESFESFRTFILIHDSTERERKGLALRRLYRTIAPWVTENPLMMHVRYSDWETVRNAIDQCAEVGFEMVILTFGSGFNIENESEDYLKEMKRYQEYAASKGIEIGGYSLLSSRRIGGGNDIVSPEGESPTHGACPALTSPWGAEYYRKLYQYFEQTGFTLLEHDGPYPGDRDITARPPLQKGAEDSRWVQWRIASDFYRWCRSQGIYVNAPDYYYLAGTNKCGMGYREVNWSLPRAQQVIHTRQNIYDGTWEKTPSMGWMFVPLTQYHGGGAAATIEPLHENIDHYSRMLLSNLAMGVQACYRGPRLYDTPETREMVKTHVSWFKTYRDILESDVIHGRRADGRGLDWMLHVNPTLEQKGMLVVFNPLAESVTKKLRVPLYYTGLTDSARVSHEGGAAKNLQLSREFTIEIEVTVEAEGMTWYVIE